MKKSAALLPSLILAVGVSGVVVYLRAQTPATSDKAAIEALVMKYNDAFNARNVDEIMSCYAPGKDLFVFDAVPPANIPAGTLIKRTGKGSFPPIPVP